MEDKVKVWLARDMNGSLYLSQIKPEKEKFDWVIENPEYSNNYAKIDANNFSSVKWEDDEPAEAYITLAETQEQSQPKIDWEQRRYEIAKDILSTMFFHPKPAINRQEDINFAVKAADMLINKLKEKSE